MQRFTHTLFMLTNYGAVVQNQLAVIAIIQNLTSRDSCYSESHKWRVLLIRIPQAEIAVIQNPTSGETCHSESHQQIKLLFRIPPAEIALIYNTNSSDSCYSESLLM